MVEEREHAIIMDEEKEQAIIINEKREQFPIMDEERDQAIIIIKTNGWGERRSNYNGCRTPKKLLG